MNSDLELALKELSQDLGRRGANELIEARSRHAESSTLRAGDLLLDLSRHLVDQEAECLLLGVAVDRDVRGRLRALFAGDPVNSTEERAAGHWALRSPHGERVAIGGVNVSEAVEAELRKASDLAEAVRAGQVTGATGRRFETVVNLGIGGSQLGPAVVAAALTGSPRSGPDVRFVSNVDPAALCGAIADLDPSTTLFVVCSKTFSTLETLANASTAREWIVRSLGADAVGKHFVAVSTAVDEACAFGIHPDRVVGFWDWVGGRYSLWSAAGLAAMIAIGAEAFHELLAGAHVIDLHVRDSPIEENVAVRMALMRYWYSGYWDAGAHAVVPYSDRLALLPEHLQQLEMESLGKSVGLDGKPIDDHHTGQVVFGSPGTDGQHAYFQLIHQGTRLVPVDFIGFARPRPECAAVIGAEAASRHHTLLLANMLAQAEALAVGRTADEVEASGVPAELAAHRSFPGGRPSTVILAPELTPSVLGQILALYEHTTFVLAALWGINPFDQFGVELGKEMAEALVPTVEGGGRNSVDPPPGLAALVEEIRAMRSFDA